MPARVQVWPRADADPSGGGEYDRWRGRATRRCSGVSKGPTREPAGCRTPGRRRQARARTGSVVSQPGCVRLGCDPSRAADAGVLDTGEVVAALDSEGSAGCQALAARLATRATSELSSVDSRTPGRDRLPLIADSGSFVAFE